LSRPSHRIFATLTLFLASLPIFGETDLSQKILLLRKKAQEHKAYIKNLLTQDASFQSSVPEAGNEIEPKPAQEGIPELLDFSKQSKVDVPSTPLPSEVVQELQQQVVANPDYTSSDPLYPFANNLPENKNDPNGLDPTNVTEAYQALYESKHPERRLGYYFGPFMGVVFPDDLTVDGTANQSGNGPLLGLRVGRDFGAIRVEGEYSYIFYDLNQGGDATLHNFFSRYILESEMGDQADFRVGIGLGLTSIGVDSEHEVCFAYDFLLGWSYRVSDFWGLSLDYRHFLTASSQTFSRMQGHVLEVSANFDF